MATSAYRSELVGQPCGLSRADKGRLSAAPVRRWRESTLGVGCCILDRPSGLSYLDVVAGAGVDDGVGVAAAGVGAEFNADVAERSFGAAGGVIGERVAPADALHHFAEIVLRFVRFHHHAAGLLRQM